MRKRGPWSRVNALRDGWPAAAFLDPRPPDRVPRPDDIAAELQRSLASGTGAAFGGIPERQAMARSLGVIGSRGCPTPLGRVWAAVWARGSSPLDLLARRVVAAGTALAADGLPILALLASSGGTGPARGVAADAARACGVLGSRRGLAQGLRADLRRVSAELEAGSRTSRGASRQLRNRVGWLAFLGLTHERLYGGWVRGAHPEPARLRQLATANLTFQPAWALRAPHLHFALWLALLETGQESAAAQQLPDNIQNLLGEAVELVPDLPLREASLLLCALGAGAAGPLAEPAAFYQHLQKLPLRVGAPFVRVPQGSTFLLARGDPQAGNPSPDARGPRGARARALEACAALFEEGEGACAEAPLGLRAALRAAAERFA